MLKERLIKVKNYLTGQSNITLIITIIILTFVVSYFVLPRRVVYKTQTRIVNTAELNNEAIKKLAEGYNKVINEQSNRIQQLLKLKNTIQPQYGYYASQSIIDTSTRMWIRVDTLKIIDSVKTTYPYDFPLYIKKNNNDISILTFNPHLSALGKPFMKMYKFNVNAHNYEITAQPSDDYNVLDGIKIVENKSILRFDGIYVYGEYSIKNNLAIGVSVNYRIYDKVILSPFINSNSVIGIKVGYKLY